MPDIHSDFSQRIVIHTRDMPWQPSPIEGVDRRMLDRLGDEVARATSIVRYAPDSHFSPHTHTGGEEFLVLEGVFEDEHGSYPAGTYIRNPPTSSHTPGSTSGCTIFVKLWQFDPNDRTQVRTNIYDSSDESSYLYQDDRERVYVQRWQASTTVEIDCAGGAEFLVLDGSLTESGDHLVKHSWCRLPDGYAFRAQAGNAGCRLWIKTKHLIYVRPPGHVQA